VQAAAAPFRLNELGALQFEQLWVELLHLEAGGAESHPWGLSLLLSDGVEVPGGARLEGPALVLVVWLRRGLSPEEDVDRLRRIVSDALASRRERSPRSLLLLTNRPDAEAALPSGVRGAALGPAELWQLYAATPAARFRVPRVLRDL
jgi:hypothetical protein